MHGMTLTSLGRRYEVLLCSEKDAEKYIVFVSQLKNNDLPKYIQWQASHKNWVAYEARVSKTLAYLRPKSAIFLTLLIKWPKIRYLI